MYWLFYLLYGRNSDKKRFADLFNGTIFEGKQVVNPNELELVKGESVVVIENKEESEIDRAVQRYRDVIMKWNNKYNLMILACENQGRVDYGMPVRLMTYDALTYTEQIREYESKLNNENKSKIKLNYSPKLKEMPLIPTFTIIFYYGEKRWDGPRELYEMFETMSEANKRIVEKFIPNYKINVVEVQNIKDFSKFKMDLQIILNMLKYRRDKVKLCDYIRKYKDYFSHLSRETMAAIGLLLNAKDKFDKVMKNEEQEEIDMCKALDDIFEDAINKGLSQGISQGTIMLIIKKIQRGKDIITIADELETDVNSIIDLYNIVCENGPEYNVDVIYEQYEQLNKEVLV